LSQSRLTYINVQAEWHVLSGKRVELNDGLVIHMSPNQITALSVSLSKTFHSYY